MVFYLLFEILLVLIYTTVSTYWYNQRAVYAVYMLVAYTVLGSSCMGVSMLIYYVIHGSLHTLGSIDTSRYSTRHYSIHITTGVVSRVTYIM